jgi:hypothetical protein
MLRMQPVAFQLWVVEFKRMSKVVLVQLSVNDAIWHKSIGQKKSRFGKCRWQ